MDPFQSDSSSYVYSWLATKDDWLNPAALHREQDQSRAQRFPRTSFVSLRRKRKRKGGMNSDTISSTSSGTTRTTASLANRPVLQPTPPSTRQRSTSPTRKVLSQLKFATPSLRVCQPDVRLEQPPMVRRLKGMLIQKLSSKIIPHCLKSQLQAADPDQFEALGHLFEDPTTVYPPSYTDALWQITDKIYNEARRCYDNHLDENAWIKIVSIVLESAELGHDSSMLRVHSIQTQSIDPAFLPRHVSQSFAKRADLAFAFSSDHPTVASTIEPIFSANPDIALSQMTDAYTSTVPLVCCLEVKERGGDYNEAIIQLGIWCAAGLERLRELCMLGNRIAGIDQIEGELAPFLGWTVVGHDWKFHLSWKDKCGNVIVLGPWRTLNAGTGSHGEILLLLALVRNVKTWLEDEYWEWLRRNVLNNLT